MSYFVTAGSLFSSLLKYEFHIITELQSWSLWDVCNPIRRHSESLLVWKLLLYHVVCICFSFIVGLYPSAIKHCYYRLYPGGQLGAGSVDTQECELWTWYYRCEILDAFESVTLMLSSSFMKILWRCLKLIWLVHLLKISGEFNFL